MNFVSLIKKVFSAREQEDKTPLYIAGGDGMVLITDKRMCVYMRDPRITGDMKQIPVPISLNEVDIFAPLLRVFIDPEGTEVEGKLALDAGDAEDNLIKVAKSVCASIVSDTTSVPDKVAKAVMSTTFVLQRTDIKDVTGVKSHTAKSITNVKGFDLGEHIPEDVNVEGTLIPLKIFKKDDHVLSYCWSIRSFLISFADEGDEYGAIIPMSFNKVVKSTKELKEKTNMGKKELLNNLIAGVTEPAPQGVQTELATPVSTVEAEPVILPENAETKDAQIMKDNIEAAKADATPVTPVAPKQEQVQDAATVERITETEPGPIVETTDVTTVITPTEEPTKAPVESDEDRLVGMMEEFNDGAISRMRESVTFLERLVKLQAKIIRKGATSLAVKQQVTDQRTEITLLRTQVKEFTAARKKMYDAMGIPVPQ